MNIKSFLRIATNKDKFITIDNYIQFCQQYLDFIKNNLQAIIVSQNETNYCFYQYKKDGGFNITRPINNNLMYNANTSRIISTDFLRVLHSSKNIPQNDETNRSIIRNSIYTIQQSIAATLDALPSGESNKARKINGDLFERLMKLLINEMGIDCRSGVLEIPIPIDNEEQISMSYQHDLLFYKDEILKLIGSVKTSSKDRLDKIFIDKFLYNKLTNTDMPHIAIFLNDVQRKQTSLPNKYGINATFLPGHFRVYTIKLNPLNGVYYCDIRPNMLTDSFLNQHIKTIDYLFCDDLKKFMKKGKK